MLQSESTNVMCAGKTSAQYELTIVFKEHDDEGGRYVVAECLEIPGCISQGDTEQEAKDNIHEALELCLSVMFEDCLKLAMSQSRALDLRGITSQQRLNVTPASPCLQYA